MSQSSFKPAWWLPGPHLQTLWPTLCRRSIQTLPLKKERIELYDGDFVDLMWAGEEKGPIVLLLHGLEGSIESPYAKGMMQAIVNRGWRSVLMHFRGCSGEPNRLQRGYHSGDTADVAYVVSYLQKRYGNVPMGAIGFSLGGNVLLKWLGETANQNPLSAAIAVSVPFELHRAAERVSKGFSKLYQWHLVKSLCDRLIDKFQEAEGLPFKVAQLKKIRSIREFDDCVTAPLHGFENASDYYLKSSSRQFLKKIQVPTLVLHAKDDPFMTEDVIPFSHELSSCVTLEVAEKGGHVGFVSGKYPWKPLYWLEERAPLFFENYL